MSAGHGTRADVVPPEVLAARAYLMRVAEPPSRAVGAFVARHGPVETADRIRRGLDLSADLDAATEARRDVDRSGADLDAMAARDGRLLVPEDPDWPAWSLKDLHEAAAEDLPDLLPPLALWVRGPLPLVDAGRGWVAVVGSRAATDYGLWVAGDWAAGLADAGMTTVSGAALGIDGAAHRGSLVAGGPTVAVLACGLDRPYPAAHSRLLDRIAGTGAVLTEYPPGTVPGRHRFLVRNRLVAALAIGTLVVEAGARSGARRTALVAHLLGRSVMVVPGPVTSAQSVGCHALARDPETSVVGRVDDVVETVGDLGRFAPDEGRPSRSTDGLSPRVLRVHEALSRRTARSARRLAYYSGVDLHSVELGLDQLERAELAERSGGRWRLRPG